MKGKICIHGLFRGCDHCPEESYTYEPPKVTDLLHQPCPQCNGYGEVSSNKTDEDGDELSPIQCHRCHGTGHYVLGLDRPGYVRHEK